MVAIADTEKEAEKTTAQEAERRRLAWRCRRGMLELDIVLQQFVANHFMALSESELAAFNPLLDLPDNDFWNLITDTDTVHENGALQSVLGKIRSNDHN